MSALRAWALPAAATVAVAALLGGQVALGGGDFVPAPVTDPCAAQPLPPKTTDLDRATQSVIVGGVQDAACELGTTREELLLALPSAPDRAALAQRLGKSEDELLAAVKRGMLASVDRQAAAGRLPKASELVPQLVGELGLPTLAEQAVSAVPPNVIDGLLPTADVVKRAIDGLDLKALLDDSGGPDAWEPAINAAIREAAIAEVREQVLDRLPSSLGDLFR